MESRGKAWLLLLELSQPLVNPRTALKLFWEGQDFTQVDNEEQISELSVTLIIGLLAKKLHQRIWIKFIWSIK